MTQSLPSDLLLHLLHASPEQITAVRQLLGIGNPAQSPSYSSPPCPTAHQLRLHLGVWELVTHGQRSFIRDCRALRLINHLLKHPPLESIHAVVWENRVDGSPLLEGFRAIEPAAADDRPRADVGAVGGVIEERSGRRFLGEDTLPALRLQLRELRAAAHDESLPAQEREEAERQLRDLLRAQARGGKLVGGAEAAVDRVRKQVKTFIAKLRRAETASGQPHAGLRAFGEHLHQHLWQPSMGGRQRLGASGKPGCFTYEPPPDVVWSE